jgi:hypothetical protein
VLLPSSMLPPPTPIRGQLADFGEACEGYPVTDVPYGTFVPPRIANPWYPDLNYIALVHKFDSPSCNFTTKLSNVYEYVRNQTETKPSVIVRPTVTGILFWDDVRPLGSTSSNGTLTYTAITPASRMMVPPQFTTLQNTSLGYINQTVIPIMALDPDYGKAYRDLLVRVNNQYNGSVLLRAPNESVWGGTYLPTNAGVLLMATLFGPSIVDGEWSQGTSGTQDSQNAALIYRQSLFIASFLVFGAVSSTLVVWFIRSKRMRASRPMDVELARVPSNKPDTLEQEEIDRWYPIMTYEDALEPVDSTIVESVPGAYPASLHEAETLDVPVRSPSPAPSVVSAISTRTNTPVCAICLDSYAMDASVRRLTCGHIFHQDCVDEWLLERSSRCPICRDNCRLEAREEVEEVIVPDAEEPHPPQSNVRHVFSSLFSLFQ